MAVVLGAAAVGGVVARWLKQPALLGYVAAGAMVALWPAYAGMEELMEALGRLGVTFLLYLVGLELPIGELKKMGRVALATGIGQLVFTTGIGFGLIKAMGYGTPAAIYLAIALAFSSTIIIVKLLSEKRDLNSLYGKIAVGFLLVQDFVAIGILVALSGLSSTGWSGWNLGLVGLKAAALIGLTMLLAGRVLPRVVGWVAGSSEILFVTSVAWCLGVAAVVASPVIGFGVEIGGFLAGLAIANSHQSLQIVSRTRPLRDFFLTLFFVSLGASISLGGIGDLWLKAVILSAFVLVGNPVIVMAIMGWMGYKKRTSFLAGLTVAQISEFSLIVVALAVRVGHVGPEVLALTTLVGVITMTVSTYLILYGNLIYRRISHYLGVFERKKPSQTRASQNVQRPKSDIIIFGLGRTGKGFIEEAAKLGQVALVDFDPQVLDQFDQPQVEKYYGDMADYELFEEIGTGFAKMVISTVPDTEDNLILLDYLAETDRKIPTIMVAVDEDQAKKLYAAGATFVLVPNRTGGEYLAHGLRHHGIGGEYWHRRGEVHRGGLT